MADHTAAMHVCCSCRVEYSPKESQLWCPELKEVYRQHEATLCKLAQEEKAILERVKHRMLWVAHLKMLLAVQEETCRLVSLRMLLQ